MKNFIVTTVICLLSLSAFADFNGSWSGDGVFTDGTKTQIPCSDITFEVEQSNLTLTMKYGYLACGDFSQTLVPTIFAIHSGHLVLNGATVGTIQGDSVHLDYITPQDLRLVLDATIVSEKMTLQGALTDFHHNQVGAIYGSLLKK